MNKDHDEDVIPDVFSARGPIPARVLERSSYIHHTKFKEEKRFQLLNPYLSHQIGLLMSYCNVGIVMQLLSTPITYYLVNTLNVSSFQLGACLTLKRLPWSLKLLFGIISDRLPINGYRRKSYLLIGWIILILCALYITVRKSPSYIEVTVIVFIMTTSFMLCHVMGETMVVERAKFEPEPIKGFLQSSCTTIMSFGLLIGAVIGCFLFNKDVWGWGLTISQFFLLTAAIPLVTFIPSWWNLIEMNTLGYETRSSLFESLLVVRDTLQLHAAWWPLLYIYIYYIFQVPNTAWTNFLILGLGFDDYDLGVLSIISSALHWAALIFYKKYLFDMSWRQIYIFTTVITLVFSSFQIILILRVNKVLGIPDIALALGDTVITTTIFAIQSVPASAMFTMILPEGHEAMTYAALSSVTSLAWMVANDIGSQLVITFDVSNDDLENGHFSGLLKLELFTTVLQLLPLVLVWMLPNNKSDQIELRDSKRRSVFGGSLIVALMMASSQSLWFTMCICCSNRTPDMNKLELKE